MKPATEHVTSGTTQQFFAVLLPRDQERVPFLVTSYSQNKALQTSSAGPRMILRASLPVFY